MAASLVLVPGPGAGAQSGAPSAPSSVSVARADGTLEASWPAVEGGDELSRHLQLRQRRELEPGRLEPHCEQHHDQRCVE